MTLEDADHDRRVREAGVFFMIAFVMLLQRVAVARIISGVSAGRSSPRRSALGRSPGSSMLEGRRLIDGCVHDWDFARFTFGEPEVVLASVRHMKEGDSTSLDTGSAIVRFQSGDELMRSWTWGLPGTACRTQGLSDVIGPKGALRFPGAPAQGAKTNSFVLTDGDGVEHALEYEHTIGQEWFDAQMDHFVTCVKEGRQPSVTGVDGKKALAIGLAVLEAGRTHKPVVLG